MPGVVFIQVEKTVESRPGSVRMRPNDPSSFFGDEFFERFFGKPGAPRRGLKQKGQGSGFLISKDGYILTNNHVVGDADKITVKLHTGEELEAVRIGSDPKSEVAVIKIEGDDFPCIELGNSADLEIGEWVIAVGNPFGLTETLTVGVVSAKGRNNIGLAEYEDFIQTDAAINPGNSGGPLLNIDGKVIGINTAIISQTGGYMGIGFAIPINMAKAIKDQLVAKGSVTRGFVGIMLNREDMDEDMAASFGLDEAGGVLVADIVEDSPAEEAGLAEGDIILRIDGDDVVDNASFRNRVAMIDPGTKVALKVFRDGKPKDVKLTIGTFPADEAAVPAAPALAEKTGFIVRDLTPELARRFNYDFDEGVIIAGVEPGSPAFEAGLQPGFLVLSVNRTPVKNAEEFAEALEESTNSQRVLLRVKNKTYSWFVLLRID